MQVNAPDYVEESGVQQLLSKKKLKSTVKLVIVTNCETVVQSPEAHMASLRELVRLFESSKIMSLKEIRLILIASLCFVFKDILPSYRIRNLTEPEKNQQMKKETKKLRFFEENLLVNYRKYTDVLRAILSSATNVGKSTRGAKSCKIDWNAVDRVTALRAACQLLEAHPRFNFSEELIQSVLPYLNNTSEKLSSIVFNTFKTVFANDREGEASLSICKAIHAFWRKMSYRLKPTVARVLSLVPIKDVADPNSNVGSKRDRKLLSRRERKKDKLERKHEKQMSETQAAKSRDERSKLNTLILNEILFVYFKLLKTTDNSQLLSAVLEGLSVYSNLINVVYVESLLSILNRLITHKSTGLYDGLNCVNTALNILNHRGSTFALETDPTRFYNHLYALLGRMAGVRAMSNEMDLSKSNLNTLSAAYARSNTPAAHAVTDYIHRAAITKQPHSSDGTADDATIKQSAERITIEEFERLTDVMLSCINSLLIRRRRDVSVNRVLAFVKRLTCAALAMSEPSCTGTILVRLIHLILLFPRCEVLFDSETEIGGAYRPDVDDPEMCLPASACLWELKLLERHSSPIVAELAKAALLWGRTAHIQGPTEATLKVGKLRLLSANRTVDNLIQLSPSECRIELAKLGAEWSETQSTADHAPHARRKRSRPSSYCPPEWLITMGKNVGLTEEFLYDSCTKRSKVTIR
ncbi:hypothetical protein AHF37_05920 [Paragonimus kellicotti]|nr:hypothetical protein AHF37_05920 [Paragonimus kellicotti]